MAMDCKALLHGQSPSALRSSAVVSASHVYPSAAFPRTIQSFRLGSSFTDRSGALRKVSSLELRGERGAVRRKLHQPTAAVLSGCASL